MIDLENEKIVFEVRSLIKGMNKVKNEVDVYCELMKQIFLSESLEN